MARLTWILVIGLLTAATCAEPFTLKLVVDRVERSALVYLGKDAERAPAPVVLAFHGFGGNARQIARSTRLHDAWPEATVVYPQGLAVKFRQNGREAPGWQTKPGDLDDRDIHFVEALLLELPRHMKVHERHIYATGMSNGALFTYELFALRPDTFAAFAPVAGAAGFVRNYYTPKPMLIIQGSGDTLVKPEWAATTRDIIRRINRCGDRTVEWAPGYLSYQPCESKMPVIWHLHDGGHIWPADATTHIVKFFKEQQLPEKR